MVEVKNLTKEDREVLKVPLETASPQTTVTVRDLRLIDKICNLLETDAEPLVFEDYDLKFLKDRVEKYQGWNPVPEARKVIFSAVDKLLESYP